MTTAPPATRAPERRARIRPRLSPSGSSLSWPWPVAALVLGSVGSVWPLPTLALLVGISAILLAVVAPRTTVALAVLAVLFVRPIEHLTGVSQVGYLDEGMVVLCVAVMPLRRVALRRSLRTFPGQWWFLGFVVCGVLSALVLHVPWAVFLTGGFVSAKGLLFGWAVAQVDWGERHLARAAPIAAGVIVLSLAAAAVNLVVPGAWNAVLASDPNAVEARSFLPSLIGPFSHPIDFGQFMTLSFVALASWRVAVRRSAFTLVLLGATALGALGSARRTASGGLAAAWLWLQAQVRSTPVLVALLACLPVAAVVLAAPLTTVVTATYQDYVVNLTPEARTVLTVDSFKVAVQHFPGGAGFGRFGSATAASNYSPEYVARGYPTIWGLGRTEEDGRFLTDTEWPAILGEAGYFGALAFVLGLVAIYRAGLRLWRTGRTPLARWAGLTATGWLVASVVQSVATVTFTGPPVYGLLFGLVGIVAVLADGQDGDEGTGRPADEPAAAGARPAR
jgi:hypothetical protein